MARKQSAPRLEFEAAAIYEYPEHLRPWLEALPKLPGVYQFHGDSDTMPLYIGTVSYTHLDVYKRQARNICIRSCPPPTWKTIAPPCRMKWPWVSPTRTSTIIWKAKRWTRASPKRSRAGI